MRPKRLPIELVLLCCGLLAGAAGGEAAEEKSPKSPKSLSRALNCCDGGDAVALGGTAGLLSKKLPPMRVAEGFAAGAAAGLACPAGGEKFENGEGLACCVGFENESEPKASPKPPNAELADCAEGEDNGGDCMPPKAFMED